MKGNTKTIQFGRGSLDGKTCLQGGREIEEGTLMQQPIISFTRIIVIIITNKFLSPS